VTVATTLAIFATFLWESGGTLHVEEPDWSLGKVLAALATTVLDCAVPGLVITVAWLYTRIETDHAAAVARCAVDSARMDEQAAYVGGVAPLKHAPSEYLTSGRFFCTIERHEGEDLFNFVTSVLGDDVLMYASDYPHSECQFPDSLANILSWSSLKPDTRRKLLWDNAARFYKQT